MDVIDKVSIIYKGPVGTLCSHPPGKNHDHTIVCATVIDRPYLDLCCLISVQIDFAAASLCNNTYICHDTNYYFVPHFCITACLRCSS